MRLGNVMAAFAFIAWGLAPLYYQFLAQPAMDELLALRIIASVPLCGLIAFAITRRWPRLSTILADRRSLLFSAIGAAIISASSYIFTWAVVNNHTTDASLGFFISPLILALLGIVITRDRLSSGMFISLLFSLGGVLFLTLHYGHVPYIALALALLFTAYSWCKKYVRYSWSTSLYVEALVMLPLAIGYLTFKQSTSGCISFEQDWGNFALYLGAAPVTILPLVFYSLALRTARMSTIGLMQYIEPSLQFLLAAYVLGEAFTEVKLIGFGMIWVGLLFIFAEQLISRYPVLRSLNFSTSSALQTNMTYYPTVSMMQRNMMVRG